MSTRNIIGLGVGAVALGLAAWVYGAGTTNRVAKPKLALALKPQNVTDAMRAVIASDREVYTAVVVEKLRDQERAVKVADRWEEVKALPSPCQMLRLGAEASQMKGVEVSYTLRAQQPISGRNLPETEVEKKGLEFVIARPDLSYAAEEILGGRWYFTAVYPDVAVNQACVTCHNEHPASSRRNYKLGEVMGALVIRVALEL